jgi:hypothetical protein
VNILCFFGFHKWVSAGYLKDTFEVPCPTLGTPLRFIDPSPFATNLLVYGCPRCKQLMLSNGRKTRILSKKAGRYIGHKR